MSERAARVFVRWLKPAPVVDSLQAGLTKLCPVFDPKIGQNGFVSLFRRAGPRH
jgi:hypothetical protein